MIKKLLSAIFLLTASAYATPAQINPEQAILNARDKFSDIKNRSIELERMKRDAYKRPVNKDFTLKFPEIKEDFEQIQKINSDVLQLTAVKAPIDYAAVLKLVSELNRRAARLESNLFSVKHNEKKGAKNKQPAIEPKEIKKLLDILDKSVNSFVHSSIFQNVNIVNSQDSLNAQKDLENVIEISSLIKEKAKKLKKDGSKK